MREVMYDQSSVLIAGVLFVSMALCIEVGYRAGCRGPAFSEASKTQVNSIQAALLGLLALLIGFTFSLSLQRFDSRSEAVVEEANAIGTAYLRSQLLTESVRTPTRDALHRYIDLRVQAGGVTLADPASRQRLQAQTSGLLDELWQLARTAVAADARPVTTGLYVQSLNELIDAYGRRSAALDRHVPEVVLFLLYGTFLLTGTIVGYAAGLGGRRASFVTYVLVALVVTMVFIIIDLDRPRRGLIEVSQQSLVALKAEVAAQQPAVPPVHAGPGDSPL